MTTWKAGGSLIILVLLVVSPNFSSLYNPPTSVLAPKQSPTPRPNSSSSGTAGYGGGGGSGGTVTDLTGTVTVSTPDGNIALTSGNNLQPGQTLTTGADGQVTIDLGGGAMVQIGPNSEFTVEPPGSGSTYSVLGTIQAIINTITGGNPVTFKTSTAITSVRGTKLSITATNTTTTVISFLHVVTLSDLSGQHTVSVGTGNKSTIRAGSLPTKPVPANDKTPPSVVSVYPAASSQTTIKDSTPVSITLSKVIDPNSGTGSNFTITDSAGAPVQGQWVVLSNTTVFRPQQTINAGAYKVTVKGGSQGVKDLFHNALASDYSFSFTLTQPFTPTQINNAKEVQYSKLANAYIQNYRRDNVSVYVLDGSTHSALQGLSVSYQQTSHDFLFGLDFLPSNSGLSSEASILGQSVNKVIGGGGWSLFTESGGQDSWGSIEPSEGSFNFASIDSLIQSALQYYPNTRFVYEFYDLVPTIEGFAPPSYANFNQISTNQQAFGNYLNMVYEHVYGLVSHYKARISYWTTQIEINRIDYGMGKLNTTIPPYTMTQAVQIDQTTVKAIRDANPAAVVILGTSPVSDPNQPDSSIRRDPLTFAQLCLQSGVKFDAVMLEAYFWSYPPSWYYDYYARFQSSVGKPLWIEESGYPSAQLPTSLPPWFTGWNSFSQSVQSEWYQYMLTEAYGSPNLIGYYLLYATDADGNGQQCQNTGGLTAFQCEIFDYAGIIDTNNQPKLSYATWRDFIANSTTSGSSLTDVNGTLSFRGFSGNYTLALSSGGSQGNVQVRVRDNVPNYFVFLKNGNGLTQSLSLEAEKYQSRAQSEISLVSSMNPQSASASTLLAEARGNYTQGQNAFNSQNYQLAEQSWSNAYTLAVNALSSENSFRVGVQATLAQAKQWLTWSIAIGRLFDVNGTQSLLSRARLAYNQSLFQNALTLSNLVLSATMLKMDGNGTGWSGIPSIASKLQASVSVPGTALKALYAVTDTSNLYLRLTVYGTPNANASYFFDVFTGGPMPAYHIRSLESQVKVTDVAHKAQIGQGQVTNSWGSDIELQIPLALLGNSSSIQLQVASLTSTSASHKTGVSDSFPGQQTPISPSATGSTTSYSLLVSEQGLASGQWGVTLDGSTQSANAGSTITFSQVSPGNHTIAVYASRAIFVGWGNVSGPIKPLPRGPPTSGGAPPQPHSFILQTTGSGSLTFSFALPVSPPVSSSFTVQNGRGNTSIQISQNAAVSLSISNVPGLNGAGINATAADLGGVTPTGTTGLQPVAGGHFFDVSIMIRPAGPQGGQPQQQQGPPPAIPICFTGAIVSASTQLIFWNGTSWNPPPGQTSQGAGACLTVPLPFLTGTVFALVSPPPIASTTTTSTGLSATSTSVSSAASSTGTTAASTSSTGTTAASTATGGGIPEFPVQLPVVVLLTILLIASYVIVRRTAMSRQKLPAKRL